MSEKVREICEAITGKKPLLFRKVSVGRKVLFPFFDLRGEKISRDKVRLENGRIEMVSGDTYCYIIRRKRNG